MRAPTAEWTSRQVVNGFAYDTAAKYLLRDRDCICGSVFAQRLEGMGIRQKILSLNAPWQNPCVERLVGSIRSEWLVRVMVVNER